MAIHRVLLVDDQKPFVLALKEALKSHSELFETDACFSVDEAVKLIETREYNLVITDIKMPNKSGIDLLLHLRAINFSGYIKVMSAFSLEENIKTINSLGIVDIIPKPLNLEWFEGMLVDFFEKEKSVIFETIDLFTVMQVINLDKKSTALYIQFGGEQGVIYFQAGEIINAEFDGLKGEEALLHMVVLNKGNINVKKTKGNIKQTINKPFLDLCAVMLQEKDKMEKNKTVRKKKVTTKKKRRIKWQE